jgi:hypothetical protein
MSARYQLPEEPDISKLPWGHRNRLVPGIPKGHIPWVDGHESWFRDQGTGSALKMRTGRTAKQQAAQSLSRGRE